MLHPAIGFLVTMLQARVERAQRLERGASAVEWVVIAAILVAICGAIAGILMLALRNEAEDIGNQIENPNL